MKKDLSKKIMLYIKTLLLSNYRISVNTETWGREACELIDYDSEHLYKDSFKVEENGYIYRCNNNVFFSNKEIKDDIEKTQDKKNNHQKLLKIEENDTNFIIKRNDYSKDTTGNLTSVNSAWFLLKQSKMNYKSNRYKIHQGEIIKIGRITTRIKEIKFDKGKNFNTIESTKVDKNNNNNNNKNSINTSKNSNKFILKNIDDDIIIQKNNNNNPSNNVYSERTIDMINQRNTTDPDFQEKIQILSLNNNNDKTKTLNAASRKNKISNPKHKKKDKVCRICYMEEEDALNNPIVQPCRCSGSCRYVHLNCLKQWINTKSCLKVDENELCSVYLFTESECELCKAKLPDLVDHNGKYYSLLDFSDEFKNYLILESLTLDKENNKFLYIICLDNNGEIKLGRGQACDILLSDVSVSRIHSKLIVEGKNIYIEDNDSKFGTLILVQSPTIKMAENLPLHLQVGRTYFKFLLEKKKNFFSCCEASVNPNSFYYHKQNEKEIETNRFLTVKTEINNDSDEDDEDDKIINDESKRDEIEEIIN